MVPDTTRGQERPPRAVKTIERRALRANRWVLLAVVDDAPGLTPDALGDVERAIGTLCRAVGTRRGIGGRHQRLLSLEPVGKHFELAGRLPVRERLKQDVVAGHRLRRAIPRAVR